MLAVSEWKVADVLKFLFAEDAGASLMPLSAVLQ